MSGVFAFAAGFFFATLLAMSGDGGALFVFACVFCAICTVGMFVVT